jgi:hypothetical protein
MLSRTYWMPYSDIASLRSGCIPYADVASMSGLGCPKGRGWAAILGALGVAAGLTYLATRNR